MFKADIDLGRGNVATQCNSDLTVGVDSFGRWLLSLSPVYLSPQTGRVTLAVRRPQPLMHHEPLQQ